MFDILTLNPISARIYQVLDDNYKVSNDCVSPDAILVRSASMHEYIVADNLLAVARAGAGVNNIPLDKMSKAGIVVFNTPGANANAVKELVICGMLLASRDILGGIQWSHTLSGKGADVPKLVEKGKSQFGGTEIMGKTLGVIGLGAIGVKVANACQQLGMSVIGYDPYISDTQKALLNANIKMVDIADIYKDSDFISLHLPLLDNTKEIINNKTLSEMKDGTVIINMSRSQLVNNDDIKQAINAGKIKSYVVDFPTEDVLNTSGIITIPHLGASTEEAEENCATMAAEQLKNYLEYGNIVNSVNFPNITVEKNTKHRLTIIYNGKSEVLTAIKQLITNIDYNLNYAVQNNIGYAIIDSNECLSTLSQNESILEQITAIDGIVAIRLI